VGRSITPTGVDPPPERGLTQLPELVRSGGMIKGSDTSRRSHEARFHGPALWMLRRTWTAGEARCGVSALPVGVPRYASSSTGSRVRCSLRRRWGLLCGCPDVHDEAGAFMNAIVIPSAKVISSRESRSGTVDGSDGRSRSPRWCRPCGRSCGMLYFSRRQ